MNKKREERRGALPHLGRAVEARDEVRRDLVLSRKHGGAKISQLEHLVRLVLRALFFLRASEYFVLLRLGLCLLVCVCVARVCEAGGGEGISPQVSPQTSSPPAPKTPSGLRAHHEHVVGLDVGVEHAAVLQVLERDQQLHAVRAHLGWGCGGKEGGGEVRQEEVGFILPDKPGL